MLLRINCNYTSSADQVSGCKWNYQTVEFKLSEAQQFLFTHLLHCHLAHLVSSSVITSDHIWSTLVIIRSDHQVLELCLVVIKSDHSISSAAGHHQILSHRPFISQEHHKTNLTQCD